MVVSAAPAERVARTAKRTVEEIGGVTAHHTLQKTEFDNLRPTPGAWARSGYIGTYQRFKEPAVRIRIKVWASWPRRLLRWSVIAGFSEAIVFFLMSIVGIPPSPNVWILTALVTFAAIATTLLMYSTSWADSQDLEDDLARTLGSELEADDEIPGDVHTIGGWQEHRKDLIEEAMEQAEQDAPDKPGLFASLKQKVSKDQREGDEVHEAPEHQPAQAEPAVTDEPTPDQEDDKADEDRAAEPDGEEEEKEAKEEKPSLLSRAKFWGKGTDEPTPDQEADKADEDGASEADEQGEKPSLLSRAKFWDKGTTDEPDA